LPEWGKSGAASGCRPPLTGREEGNVPIMALRNELAGGAFAKYDFPCGFDI
jgi:hypothetical protein